MNTENITNVTVDLDQQLSDHFTLREFVRSGTAIRMGIENIPMSNQVQNLKALCVNVLEPLRRRFGVIRITSGYRCKRLNRVVGGNVRSQHLSGEAADMHISCEEVGQKMFDFIRRETIFDQLIYEHDEKRGVQWIHVSYRADGMNRRQAFCKY